MLNKTLTVTTLILLIWLSNETLKIKKANTNLKGQLTLIEQQLIDLKTSRKKTSNLLGQIQQKQKFNFEKLLTTIKQKPKKDNKQKAKGNKKKEKKNIKNKKKPSTKELHSLVTQYLSDIDKNITDKKLPDATKKLSKLKKALWGIRNNSNIKKDKILSILSSIDALQKKIKKKKSKGNYSTKKIKIKIAALKLGAKNEK